MKTVIQEHVSDRTLQFRENKLLKAGLLKLRDISQEAYKTKKSPKRVLWEILKNVWYRKDTLYVNNGAVECTATHVGRSQGDLFRIMKYYYPTITFKDFRILLFELVNDGCVHTNYCNTIHKRIFYKIGPYMTPRSYTSIWADDTKDEHGFILKTQNIPE